MRVVFCGVSREERLNAALEVGVSNLMLDYMFVKNLSQERLETIREAVPFLGVEFDLSSRWSRVKSLWSNNPSSSLVSKAGSIESAKDLFIEKVENLVENYCQWVLNTTIAFDVVALPYLPIDHTFDCQKLLKTIVCMPTATNIEDLETLIPDFEYVALSKDVTDKTLIEQIRALTPLLRSFSCKLHGWGKVTKENVLSGAFWSSSTNAWYSGGTYGNTYEYVGNLKLNQYHATKGAGKEARRAQLKVKCSALGMSPDMLIDDDKATVDLWNTHQWNLFAIDAEKVSGYWSDRKEESRALVNETKPLAHSHDVVRYSRSCNSCFLSSQCPVFEADSFCKIPTTPDVNNADDIQGLLNKVIQIQGDRVMFSAFAEKVQNAGINPEVSKELETLTKLMKDARDICAPVGSDELTIKARGSGIISRLFSGYGKSGGSTKPSMSQAIIDVSPLEDEDD